MNLIDFLKLVGEIRNNCGLECTGPNYYIFIHKGLKRATVNCTGYINMCDVEYIIVVCAHNWKYLGCVNTSLTQLLMVDNEFNSIESIPFGEWAFKGLSFKWYRAWRPYPKLELVSNPRINNYDIFDEYVEKFPEWIWPNADIKQFQLYLNSINEFVEKNKNFQI